jgi:hypothetical protein
VVLLFIVYPCSYCVKVNTRKFKAFSFNISERERVMTFPRDHGKDSNNDQIYLFMHELEQSKVKLNNSCNFNLK